jgi:uncharacterized integral membrane protein
MMMLRRTLAGALLVGLLYVGWRFATGNAEPVRIDYLLGELSEVALWHALLAAFAGGLVVASLLAGLGLIRARLETRGYRKAMEGLETEVHQLRNLPLVTEDTPAQPPSEVATVAKGGSA